MTQVPTYLQDASALLSESGFKSAETWYHGTSSALLDSILEQGLKGSGDQALQQATLNTMTTIGEKAFTPSKEPVFLTQSRELAFYWAERSVRERGVRFAGDEQPVVLALDLPETLRQRVKPDVGAAALLLVNNDGFFEHLQAVYSRSGFSCPELDALGNDRMDYLTRLGMAYIDQDIAAEHLHLLTD
ncbi:MAG: hypothetical protein ACJAWL_000891 [Motiliproteus sp.]|jgi:hypothetical protein